MHGLQCTHWASDKVPFSKWGDKNHMHHHLLNNEQSICKNLLDGSLIHILNTRVNEFKAGVGVLL